jgi:hypothetical protein
MTTFRIEIDKSQGPKKSSKDFSEEEKKALFAFLEKNDEDENAMKFAQEWFNCTQMTLMMLIVEDMQKKGDINEF